MKSWKPNIIFTLLIIFKLSENKYKLFITSSRKQYITIIQYYFKIQMIAVGWEPWAHVHGSISPVIIIITAAFLWNTHEARLRSQVWRSQGARSAMWTVTCGFRGKQAGRERNKNDIECHYLIIPDTLAMSHPPVKSTTVSRADKEDGSIGEFSEYTAGRGTDIWFRGHRGQDPGFNTRGWVGNFEEDSCRYYFVWPRQNQFNPQQITWKN